MYEKQQPLYETDITGKQKPVVCGVGEDKFKVCRLTVPIQAVIDNSTLSTTDYSLPECADCGQPAKFVVIDMEPRFEQRAIKVDEGYKPLPDALMFGGYGDVLRFYYFCGRCEIG